MKFLLILLLSAAVASNVLDAHNYDFLENKRLLIVYADGTPKNLITSKAPVVESYREGGFEVRNFCETINCNYHFTEGDRNPNRFKSNRCYLINTPYVCDNKLESQAVRTVEQIIHEGDFAMAIDLDGETYSIIGNSKTEDSLIMLSDDGFSVQLEGTSLGKMVKE